MRKTFAGQFNKNDVINLEIRNLTDVQLTFFWTLMLSATIKLMLSMTLKLMLLVTIKLMTLKCYQLIFVIAKMKRIGREKEKGRTIL